MQTTQPPNHFSKLNLFILFKYWNQRTVLYSIVSNSNVLFLFFVFKNCIMSKCFHKAVRHRAKQQGDDESETASTVASKPFEAEMAVPSVELSKAPFPFLPLGQKVLSIWLELFSVTRHCCIKISLPTTIL